MNEIFISSIEPYLLLLKDLEKNSSNFSKLLELQLSVLDDIIELEKLINNQKKILKEYKRALKLGRGSKQDSNEFRQKIQDTQTSIDGIRQFILQFKQICDSLAFIYVDKWDLKPLAYIHSNRDFKQDAGFISGKKGLENEIGALRDLINSGIPCILSDLSNSIRHGDICVLISPPQIIEVKSSKKWNSRGKRQFREISKIQKYLNTDEAEFKINLPFPSEYQQLGTRVSPDLVEENFIDILNDLIDIASKHKYAVCEVEDDLIYTVWYGDKSSLPDPQDLFNSQYFDIHSILNLDNEIMNFISYTPIFLNIKEVQHLLKFLGNDLWIIISVNSEKITNRIQQDKSIQKVEIEFESDIFISYKYENGWSGGISRHFFSRIFYDFLSLNWIIDTNQEMLYKKMNSFE